MSFFSKLIGFGRKPTKENPDIKSKQASNLNAKGIVFDDNGHMYCFGKLVIDGKLGFKKSDGVFYGKETEDDEPAYYLKANGNKATLKELKGIDTGIWFSVSALIITPFVENSPNNKNLGFDKKEDLQQIVNAYQDLTSIIGLSDITLEEYTKLKREIFEYFNPNITGKRNIVKLERSGSVPRITKNPITKKYEVIYVPKSITKSDFEAQYFENLKREVETQKREQAELGYIAAGEVFNDINVRYTGKSVRRQASGQIEQKHIEMKH